MPPPSLRGGKRKPLNVASLKPPKVAIRGQRGRGTMFGKDKPRPARPSTPTVADEDLPPLPFDLDDPSVFQTKSKMRSSPPPTPHKVLEAAEEVVNAALEAADSQPKVADAVLAVASAATEVSDLEPKVAEAALNVATDALEVASESPKVAEVAADVAEKALKVVKAAEEVAIMEEIGGPEAGQEAEKEFVRVEQELEKAESLLNIEHGPKSPEQAAERAEMAIAGAEEALVTVSPTKVSPKKSPTKSPLPKSPVKSPSSKSPVKSPLRERTPSPRRRAARGTPYKSPPLRVLQRRVESLDLNELDELLKAGKVEMLLHPDLPSVLEADPQGKSFRTCYSTTLVAKDCMKDVIDLKMSYVTDIKHLIEMCEDIISQFESFTWDLNPSTLMTTLNDTSQRISKMHFFKREGNFFRRFAKECFFLHLQGIIRNMLLSHPNPSVVCAVEKFEPECYEMVREVCAPENFDNPEERRLIIAVLLQVTRMIRIFESMSEYLQEVLAKPPSHGSLVRTERVARIDSKITAFRQAMLLMYPILTKDFCWSMFPRTPVHMVLNYADISGFESIERVNRILNFYLDPNNKTHLEVTLPEPNKAIPSNLINLAMSLMAIQYRLYNLHGFQVVSEDMPKVSLKVVANKRRIVQILPNSKNEWFCVTTLFAIDETPAFHCFGVNDNFDAELQQRMRRLVNADTVTVRQGWQVFPSKWLWEDDLDMREVNDQSTSWKSTDSGVIAIAAAVGLCEGIILSKSLMSASEARAHLTKCLNEYKFSPFPRCW